MFSGVRLILVRGKPASGDKSVTLVPTMFNLCNVFMPASADKSATLVPSMSKLCIVLPANAEMSVTFVFGIHKVSRGMLAHAAMDVTGTLLKFNRCSGMPSSNSKLVKGQL